MSTNVQAIKIFDHCTISSLQKELFEADNTFLRWRAIRSNWFAENASAFQQEMETSRVYAEFLTRLYLKKDFSFSRSNVARQQLKAITDRIIARIYNFTPALIERYEQQVSNSRSIRTSKEARHFLEYNLRIKDFEETFGNVTALQALRIVRNFCRK